MGSTAEHVKNSYNSRTETARELLDAYDSDNEDTREDAQQELSEFPLAVDRKVLVTITLGYGGPSDWIDAVCAVEGGVLGLDTATYTASWSSHSKTTELSEADPLWQLAEHYIEGMEA